MKKIASFLLTAFAASTLFALPLFAEESGSMTPKTPKTLTPEMVTCVQTALDARDTSIIGAVDAYATAAKAALTARKDALKAAWAIPTPKEMRAALKTAWANYKKGLTDARKSFRASRKSAWATFRTDRKACKSPHEIDNSSENSDSKL